LSVKISALRSGRTAKAGTVSVGKLTNFPDLALATKDIKETKATESLFLQIA